MTLDLSLFTPEVLATLELKNGKIRPTHRLTTIKSNQPEYFYESTIISY